MPTHVAALSEMSTENELDIKRYDRQIRLWGLDTQRGLQGARILVLGVNGLSNEICKNLVLAGVGHLHIQDPGVLTADDLALGGLFSVSAERLGAPRAKVLAEELTSMNPSVNLVPEVKAVGAFTADFLRGFHFVVGTRGADALHEVAACTALTEAEPPKKRRRDTGTAGDGDRAATVGSNGTHEVVPERASASAGAPRSPHYLAAGCLGLDGFCFFDLGGVSVKVTPAKKLSAGGDDAPAVEPPLPHTERALYPTISAASRVEWGALTPRVPRLYYALQLLMTASESKPSGADKETAAKLLPADMPLATAELLPGLLARRAELLAAEAGGKGAKLVSDEYLAQLARTVGVELAPVCAILGGIIGSEIIKIISGKEKPINNAFFFDGATSDGICARLGPSFDCADGPNKGAFKRVEGE